MISLKKKSTGRQVLCLSYPGRVLDPGPEESLAVEVAELPSAVPLWRAARCEAVPWGLRDRSEAILVPEEPAAQDVQAAPARVFAESPEAVGPGKHVAGHGPLEAGAVLVLAEKDVRDEFVRAGLERLEWMDAQVELVPAFEALGFVVPAAAEKHAAARVRLEAAVAQAWPVPDAAAELVRAVAAAPSVLVHAAVAVQTVAVQAVVVRAAAGHVVAVHAVAGRAFVAAPVVDKYAVDLGQ
jgi:hypothetical protein